MDGGDQPIPPEIVDATVNTPPPPEVAETPKPSTPGMSPCTIKVIGVGGGGGNTLNRMVSVAGAGSFIDFVAINTDIQALAASQAGVRVQIGDDGARGLGAGGIPAVGRASAIARGRPLPNRRGHRHGLCDSGYGRRHRLGRGSRGCRARQVGGLPDCRHRHEALLLEGQKRMNQALEAIENLQSTVDILVTVSNDKLLEIVPEGMPLNEAFSIADEILRQGIMGISEIIAKPGLINVDFADVRAVMQDAGPALMGIGTGVGKTRAYDAAVAAISSPLLDFPIERAKGVVFTITGNSGMSLQEVNEVAAVISEIVADDANIIFGTSVDEDMDDAISVTVVATSFDTPEEEIQRGRFNRRRRRRLSAAAARVFWIPPPDPYQPPAPATGKPRFWGRF